MTTARFFLALLPITLVIIFLTTASDLRDGFIVPWSYVGNAFGLCETTSVPSDPPVGLYDYESPTFPGMLGSIMGATSILVAVFIAFVGFAHAWITCGLSNEFSTADEKASAILDRLEKGCERVEAARPYITPRKTAPAEYVDERVA